MTDELVKALVANCPKLHSLEVYFERYTRPSELFTDCGLIALAEGYKRLQRLTLHNCFNCSNRSLYALAAQCPDLTALCIGGYNEKFDDVGLGMVFEACPGLQVVQLCSRLPHVTSAALLKLAHGCRRLRAVKLPSCTSDEALLALATFCRHLTAINAKRCTALSKQGIEAAAKALPPSAVINMPATLASESEDEGQEPDGGKANEDYDSSSSDDSG